MTKKLLLLMAIIMYSSSSLLAMIAPPYLQKGDCIRVVAPAGVVDAAKTKAGIALWEAQGYEVIVGKHVYARHNRFAGTDQERLADLQEAMNDPNCKAIIAVRGGYGSVRIVEDLDFTAFNQKPKWLVGFSDITVLHAEFQRRGYQSIHGPMVASSIVNGKASKSFSYLVDVLEGRVPSYQIAANANNRSGNMEGEIVGGNLSIVYGLLGKTDMLNTDGKILFIEDLGEQLYHLDRMMYSLKISGKLDHVKGILVGEFIKMKDTGNMNESVEQIIRNACADYNFPIVFDFPAGHDDNNYPLVLGKPYSIVQNAGVSIRPLP